MRLLIAALFIPDEDNTATARRIGAELSKHKTPGTKGDLVIFDPANPQNAGVALELHHLDLNQAAHQWLTYRKDIFDADLQA